MTLRVFLGQPERRRGLRRRAVKRAFPWVVVGLVLLGFALRLPYLTARSLWFDEAFSWRLIQFPFREFIERAAADVHPLLYYVLLWLWMLPARAFGAEATLFWMRFLSVLLGAATVASMVMAGRALFRSRWAGGVAGLLTAVNAFQLQYAWEARMYTLGTVLLPLAMAGLVRTVEARTARLAWRASFGFAFSLGLLLHVHYFSLFSWVALGGAKLLFFVASMRRGVRLVLFSPNFRAAEVGFWLSAVTFLPWLPVFLAQAQRVQAAYWIPRIDALSVPNTMARLFWGGVSDIAPWAALLASAAALALVIIPLVRGRSFGDFVAAASFVGPLVLAVLVSVSPRSVYLDRYFLFASLGFILLAARTLSLLPRKFRLPAVGLVVLFSLVSIAQFWRSLDFPSHQGARAAAAFLRTNAAAGDPVVVSSSFVYFPVAFHLGCRMPDARCQNGLAVRLYSETGELAHFSGGPILTSSDIVGPEVFEARPVPRSPQGEVGSPLPKSRVRLWAIDTTGFGGSRLAVPSPYQLEREEHFPELFSYQGDMIVREYRR